MPHLQPSPVRWQSVDEFLKTDQPDQTDPVLRILLTSDGTITTALQGLWRVPIAVEIIRQEEVSLDPATAQFLSVKPGQPVLARDIWLKAREHRLVCASSVILLEGINRSLLESLRSKQKPLGLLLNELGWSITRDKLEITRLADQAAAAWISPPGVATGAGWARRYRMGLGEKMSAFIQEIFTAARPGPTQ